MLKTSRITHNLSNGVFISNNINNTLANATLVKEVASLRAELSNNSYHQAKSNPDGRFSKTVYFWPHGYKLSKTHNSDSCTKGKDGHKDKSARRNTMVGSEWNKGRGT